MARAHEVTGGGWGTTPNLPLSLEVLCSLLCFAYSYCQQSGEKVSWQPSSENSHPHKLFKWLILKAFHMIRFAGLSRWE